MPDPVLPAQPSRPAGPVSEPTAAPVPASATPAGASAGPDPAGESVRAGLVWGGAMWRVAGTVATQTALISAILYYFGTIRLRATFDYFGVDASALGFSVADYLIHSVNAAFQPLIFAGLAVLPALTLHRRIVVPVLRGTATARRVRWVRRVARGCRTAGIGGGLLVAAGLLDRGDIGQPLGIGLPLILAASVALLAYGHVLRDRPDQPEEAAIPAQLRSLALTVLAVAGLLWATGLYAQRIGRDYARYLAANLDARPQVVLYAPERLAIAGDGVASQDLGEQAGRYRIRYWNLRLLAQRNDLLLLLPDSWRPGNGPVYVVPAADTRLDLTVPPRSTLPDS
ncbi:hypothetical protein J2S43_003320 [Catenuloplanes nepalensis]|uniref:DUF5671 domain-containing protein n=1 Tax=Catenuloplanes nepalensis TaxID=587533 RepID=A0ABT9MU69_9ACTN|nr:hypothetical protein [Catenuloplanes nepalensis]MDP9794808.1 hypothetical protein [Catenuloplanes nepalensis]